MDNALFRKSSIDRLNSPEQLNEYIRVAKPGVWLILAAVVLLLVGALAWGVFGLVESKLVCGALVQDGRAICYVSQADAEKIHTGDAVALGETDASVKSIAATPVPFESEDAYLMRLCGLNTGEPCHLVELEAGELEAGELAEGIHPAVITVESLRPIHFVIH